LAERGIEVDHVTIFRWVQRFSPLFVEAARALRRPVGSRWFVDETYVKVSGHWRYLYRAIDQFGQVIDVFLSTRRDAESARGFFQRASAAVGSAPKEVITDRYRVYPAVLEDLVPTAVHDVRQNANNAVECDHRRLKARLRPMRGLKHDHTARVIVAGHAFVQNVRRGHYSFDRQHPGRVLMDAFAELSLAI
jgi:transposase-like protein